MTGLRGTVLRLFCPGLLALALLGGAAGGAAAQASDDATLQDLQLSAGPPPAGFMMAAMSGALPEGNMTLDPVLDPDVSAYTASLVGTVVTVRLHTTVAVEGVEVTGETSGGDDLETGNSASVNSQFESVTLRGLEAGLNTIAIVVTAEDGETTRTYTLAVDSGSDGAAPDYAALQDLQLSTGPPSPGFMFAAMAGSLPDGDMSLEPDVGPDVTAYATSLVGAVVTVRLHTAVPVEDIDVTAETAGGDALEGGNSSRVNSQFASVTFGGLELGVNTITIVVTGENDTTRTYTVAVTRES